MPGHALDVVDGVAHQRQHVHDLIGRHAELLLHAGGVVPGAVVARVEDADAVADELKEILVSRDDRHVVTLRAARSAIVPITSSASKRSELTIGTPSASQARWTSGICTASSSGIGPRFAL